MTDLCAAPDCGRRVKARGLCSTHYERLRVHGDPLHGGAEVRSHAPLADRLARRVDRRGPDDCWLFTGRTLRGYGRIADEDGADLGAHRAAWIVAFGPIPPEKPHVLHSCDNPPCCNPRHLFLGTHSVNMADRNAKGRQSRGEHRPTAKVTEAQVAEIRVAYAAGGVTQRELGERYGLDGSQVSRIVRGQRWAA